MTFYIGMILYCQVAARGLHLRSKVISIDPDTKVMLIVVVNRRREYLVPFSACEEKL